MLPELPKKHKKKEADFGTNVFRPWILSHPNMMTGSYEMKDTRGKPYINFKELTDEQVSSALRVQSDKGELIKVITSGTVGVADYIFLRREVAYIVIKYPKSAEIITIENLLHEKKKGKKSLTYDRAVAISSYSI